MIISVLNRSIELKISIILYHYQIVKTESLNL